MVKGSKYANKKKPYVFTSLATALRAERVERASQPVYKTALTTFLRENFVEKFKTKCFVSFTTIGIYTNGDTIYISPNLMDDVINFLTNSGFMLSNTRQDVFEVILED